MKKKRLLTDRSGELHEELEAELAKTLQEEIDWEILSDMLKVSGWTGIEVRWPSRMSESDAHEIKEWCKANLTGNYKGRGSSWIFQHEKDAVLFSLRWA